MTLTARSRAMLRGRALWREGALGALCAAIAGFCAVSFEPRPGVPVPALVTGALLLGLLVAMCRRSEPAIPTIVSALLAAALPPVTIALSVCCYAMGRYERRWPVTAGAGVIGAVAVVQPELRGQVDTWTLELGAVAAVVVLPIALGIWQRTRSSLMEALRERATRAEAEQRSMADQAVRDERSRIAREMHDAVGHRVSLMALQAGAIEMAAADRDRVEVLARQVQTAGRSALEELRHMVGVLRADDRDTVPPLGPQPGFADLARLVDDARTAGMTVEFAPVEDDIDDPAVARAAFRIIQEALTNAGKHAPDAPVHVSVERRPRTLIVRVVNERPSRPPAIVGGGGFGLLGLRERVRLVEGTLVTRPLHGGFLVEAELPR